MSSSDNNAAVAPLKGTGQSGGSPPERRRAPSGHGALGGRVLVAVAAIMWSTSGLFAKATTFEAWPADQRGILLAFWRAAFAGLLLLPAVRRPQWDVRLIPLCIAFTAMNVTYLSAMTSTTAANAIWLQSTAPWWVLLIGVIALGEPFPRRELVPLVVGGLGLALILACELQGQARTGVLFGLASGFSYSCVVLSLRALRGVDTVWIISFVHLVTAVLILPYVLYIDVWPSLSQLPVLAGFGLIQMALPYVLFARGLRAITSQEATVIGLLEPIVLPVWVYLAWDEVPAWWTVVGGGLILAGLLLRYGAPLLRARRATA